MWKYFMGCKAVRQKCFDHGRTMQWTCMLHATAVNHLVWCTDTYNLKEHGQPSSYSNPEATFRSLPSVYCKIALWVFFSIHSGFPKWVAAPEVHTTSTRNSSCADLIESANATLPFPENLTLLTGKGRPQESWFTFFASFFRLNMLRTTMLESAAIKVTNLQLFNSGWILRVCILREISTQ